MNILVFDNYPVSRIGVTVFLNEVADKGKIYAEENAENALEIIRTNNPSIIFVNSEGSENFFAMLEKDNISTRSVVYYNEFNSALEVKKKFNNIVGMISLKSDKNEFKDCLIAVQKGGPFYCNVTLDLLLNQLNFDELAIRMSPARKHIEKGSQGLSFRENQIKDLLKEGRSTKEIGEILKLKGSTVSTNKAKIFKKLGVSNIVQLIKVYENEAH